MKLKGIICNSKMSIFKLTTILKVTNSFIVSNQSNWKDE